MEIVTELEKADALFLYLPVPNYGKVKNKSILKYLKYKPMIYKRYRANCLYYIYNIQSRKKAREYIESTTNYIFKVGNIYKEPFFVDEFKLIRYLLIGGVSHLPKEEFNMRAFLKTLETIEQRHRSMIITSIVFSLELFPENYRKKIIKTLIELDRKISTIRIVIHTTPELEKYITKSVA